MSLHHGLRSAAGASVADPYFANTSLLLLGNGSNGGQNNTFVDGSSNAFSVTRYGNTTQGTFSPFGYNWSNYFDGNGDYLVFTPGADFAFGTGDFTVECWYFPTVDPTDDYIFDTRTSSSFTGLWAFAYNSTGTDPGKLFWANNTTQLGQSSVTTVTNAWNHLCYVRSGTTGSLYVNGTRVGTQTDNYNYSTNPGAMRMGARYSVTTNNQYAKGYLSNVRVVKGTAVYDPAQTSFAVPTAPLTAITNTKFLTCQSNRFIDNSSNAFTITPYGDARVTNFAPFATGSEYSTGTNGGSGYFDGSGDYLEIAGNSAFAPGTGNFTVEGWVYLTSSVTTNYAVFSSVGNSSVANDGIYIGYDNYGTATLNGYIGNGTGSGNVAISTTSFALNAWTHIALTRSGTTLTLWVNGSSVGTATDTHNITATNTVLIGKAFTDLARYLPGYISNVRFLKGTAQYTANFTPSTTPLTAIANTSLLLNFTNAAILDSTGKNDIETVGDAQISTSVKKYGTGSLKFDGTGDYLTANSTSLSSGDFTIECWAYLNATTNNPHIFSYGTSEPNRFSVFRDNATGKWAIAVVNSGTYTINTGSTTASASTWFHLAFVRNGSTNYLYVNGVSEASNTASVNSGSTVIIGGNFTFPAGDFFNGNIDDFRITKGIARYPSGTAFTPPTRQLPAR